uniref:Myb/SANT-like domain-containing protein n=1 Tax=Oryza rufipogon TaxID=4529 RepID=A0A0E0PGY4_ORYRU
MWSSTVAHGVGEVAASTTVEEVGIWADDNEAAVLAPALSCGELEGGIPSRRRRRCAWIRRWRRRGGWFRPPPVRIRRGRPSSDPRRRGGGVRRPWRSREEAGAAIRSQWRHTAVRRRWRDRAETAAVARLRGGNEEGELWLWRRPSRLLSKWRRGRSWAPEKDRGVSPATAVVCRYPTNLIDHGQTFFSSSRELRERAIGRVCHGLILITCTHGIHLHKLRVFLSSMAAKPEAQMGSDVSCSTKNIVPASSVAQLMESVMAVCRIFGYRNNLLKMEKGKVPKAHWDAYASKVFCEICRDEVLAGNRPTAALSPLGYKNLEEKFFAQTGRQYDRTKLKNRWDTLKTQHKM